MNAAPGEGTTKPVVYHPLVAAIFNPITLLPFIFLVLPFLLLWRSVNRIRNKGVEDEDWFTEHLPTWATDLLRGDLVLGMYLGLGMGIWATTVKAVEGTESSDLIGLAQAGVGLLAIVLALMGLLMGFLSDRTEKLVRESGGITEFYRPFKLTAWISALAILMCIAGAIDSSSVTRNTLGNVVTSPGPTWLAAVLYGASVWVFVWAVIGVAQLVRIFILWGRVKEETPEAPATAPTGQGYRAAGPGGRLPPPGS